ncbi:tryptophan synthase beta subunit-like PLP-dependent enzyme [Morchella conica CCBAS932]|uniref:Tryptophan synthase beta subunit-like PLP-dependent enzyme n=1 Tax=Morchella conica CCBAS932 TaxID=1392247 RepID=A0A3N4KV47_9PEZI|nr:tryptophan synthase beta subunit-like PLP-dependent enzyme [Morchella conica CCBAS932]
MSTEAAPAPAPAHIHRTPVLTSTTLSALASTPTTPITLLFKAENLQKIGNHAQALALAARTASQTRGFPIPAYIIMPHISTPSKIAATRSYGGILTFSGPTSTEREAATAEVQARTGAAYIPPYDHGDIILGQGTMALELQAQAAELGYPLDAIVAPCGGGGMLSGVAIACEGTGVRVYGAEPREGADDAARGLEEGRRVEKVVSRTVADGLRTPLGVLNWGVVSDKGLVKGVFTVGEEEILSAMGLVVERMKVLVEPSGAVPVAVVLGGEGWKEEVERWAAEEGEEARARRGGRGYNVGVVLSGGNTTIEKIVELFGKKKE